MTEHLCNLDKNVRYNNIFSDGKWIDYRLGEDWQYQDLILLFAGRFFALICRKTMIGDLI